MLIITPVQQDNRAVQFNGKLTKDLSMLIESMDLIFVDDLEGTDMAGTRCFIDGDDSEETSAIFPGDYFVVCGPFWDVMSEKDFNIEFKATEE